MFSIINAFLVERKYPYSRMALDVLVHDAELWTRHIDQPILKPCLFEVPNETNSHR